MHYHCRILHCPHFHPGSLLPSRRPAVAGDRTEHDAGVWLQLAQVRLDRCSQCLVVDVSRFGLYPTVKTLWGVKDGEDIGLLRKMGAGLTTGAVGSALANPCDLVKIRMQREAGIGVSLTITYKPRHVVIYKAHLELMAAYPLVSTGANSPTTTEDRL